MLTRLFAALALVVALTYSGVGPADAKVVGKAATWVGPKHPVNMHGYQPFIERVEKKSNGELSFRLFMGSSLLGPKAVLTGVRDGVADVAMYALTYFPAEFPHFAMLAEAPVIGDHATIVGAAVTEYVLMHCQECRAELEPNMVYLGSFSTSPYVLVNRRGKIEKPADMQGKKVRVSTGLHHRWLVDVDAVPVRIPSSDMYDALSRGVIDMAIYAPGGLTSHGLADVAKDITLLRLGTFPVGVLMGFNPQFWNSLSKEHRKLILDEMPRAMVEATMGYESVDANAIEIAASKGVNMHEPSAELTTQLKAFLRGDMATAAAEVEKKGKVKDALPKMEKFAELMDKWTKLMTPHLNDADKLTELVKTEIYDKVDPKMFGI